MDATVETPSDERTPRWFLPTVFAMGFATAFSRLPFVSRYLFAWDSANFALALDQYNVAFHQPQPPGYPLYVATGWLIRWATGMDANASYVTLSVVASAVAVSLLAVVGAKLFDPVIGTMAAVIFATSALFWGQGVVAYPYAILAVFASGGAWLALEIRAGGRRSVRLAVTGAVVLAIGSGYRSEIAPFLAPLWFWAVLGSPGTHGNVPNVSPNDLRIERGLDARFGRFRLLGPDFARVQMVLLGGVAGAVTIAGWYVPMVLATGGWDAYQSATGGYYAYFIQSTSGVGKQLLGVLENLRALVNFGYAGLGLGLLVLLADLGVRFRPSRLVADTRSRVFVLWLAPPTLFYLLVHLGNPGYLLTILPGASLLIAVGARDLVRDALQAVASGAGARWDHPITWAVVAIVATVNSVLFLIGPGEGRRREIQAVDVTLHETITKLNVAFSPTSTLIVAYDRSRQYRYYLPAYRHALLFDVAVAGIGTDTTRYWERRTRFTVPPDVSRVVFPDLGENLAEQSGLVRREQLGDGVDWWVADVSAGDQMTWGFRYAVGRRS